MVVIMILDWSDINFLNETAVTEALSSDLNLMFGVVLIFIGIVFLYSTFNLYKKDKRKLKKINRW